MLWAQQTSASGSKPIKASFAREVQRALGRRISLVRIESAATVEFTKNVATGAAALRMVLAAIAARAGRRAVVFGGLSQGSWVASEVFADPRYRALVARAVLFGHPGVAARHFAGEPSASNILEVNHPDDQVTARVTGDPQVPMDAMSFATKPSLGTLPGVLRMLVGNPAFIGHELLSLGHLLLPGVIRGPHDYDSEMGTGVAFLRGGIPQDLLDAAA